MRTYIAVLALCLVAALELPTISSQLHTYKFRPATGRFTALYTHKLYQVYAKVFFLGPKEKENSDNPENYSPTINRCINYLTAFRIHSYEIKVLEELVLLDACLGYLYDEGQEKYHSEDSELVTQGQSLDQFINDETLKALYDSAKTFTPENQDSFLCEGNLLYKKIVYAGTKPGTQCGTPMVQNLLEFAKCSHDKGVSEESIQEDSYLRMLHGEVKKLSAECFQYEIRTLMQRANGDYKSTLFGVANKFGRFVSKTRKVAHQRKLSEQEITLFRAAVLGPNAPINVHMVSDFVKAILRDQIADYKNKFLANMATYADKNINAKEAAARTNDATGNIAYRQLVDNLCNKFRSSTDNSRTDFAASIAFLEKMLSFQDVLGITSELFKEKIFENSPMAALYFSVNICNILTFTEGAISTGDHSEPKYTVTFKPDTSAMVKWPTALKW